MLFNMFYGPFIPPMCDKPPTIYTILESIVNGDKEPDEDETKIKDLAKEGRSVIFSFNYPLTNTITKEDFECMILNHYMTRRIGFDTVTNFKLHLQVKLNAIMPKYNILFDNLEHILDNEIITKTGTDNVQSSTNASTSNNATTSNTSNSTTDNRYSDTPQDQLADVRDGKYVTDYTYNQNNTTNSGSSNSNGTSNGTGTNDRSYTETIVRNNIGTDYFKIQDEMNNIYDMIFNELDCLFYSIV